MNWFGRTWIYTDGKQDAGKSTFCSLLLNKSYDKISTSKLKVRKNWRYVIKDVPGGEGEDHRMYRENTRDEYIELRAKKTKCVFIFFFDALQYSLEDRESSDLNNRLDVPIRMNIDVIVVGSRADKIGENTKKEIENLFHAKGIPCKIFDLTNKKNKQDVLDFIEKYTKE